jgi:outer membrane lipoprotein-sorting protein
MKHLALVFAVGLSCAALSFGTGPKPKPDESANLESVLRRMDAASANFRSAQAEFEWDNYQRVIDEVVDVQTGTVYYRRESKDIEMMANVKKAGPSASDTKPEPKYVLFSEGKVRMYEPKIDRVTVYDLGKNKADLESYLVLGFGGSGQDLQKAFDVSFQGTEKIGEVNAAKLQLIPKSEGVKKYYNRMVLWIDTDKGVLVQQQLFAPQGDYRLCKYTGIKVNEKVSDEVFKLKTTGKTQTIAPKG